MQAVFLVRLQRRQVRIAAAVEADHGEIKAAVGAENLTIALGIGPDSQPCCPYRKCIEKLTSIDHSSTLYNSITQQYTARSSQSETTPGTSTRPLVCDCPRQTS